MNETDNELEPAEQFLGPAADIEVVSAGGKSAPSRLRGELPDESRSLSSEISRRRFLEIRIFLETFAVRIANCERLDRASRSAIVATDQPGIPLSISALVGNFFTNINSR